MRVSAGVVIAVIWFGLVAAARSQAEEPVASAGPTAAAEPRPDDGGGPLEQLDWMVGDWVLVPDDDVATKQLGTMSMTVRWDKGRMFLIREATLTPPPESGEPEVVLHQRIGWDPVVGRIRSWSFSTDGSRSEATWIEDRGSWIVRGTATLPDGTQTSSVNVYTFDGKDRFTWRIVRPPLAAAEDPPTRAIWVRKPGGAGP